LLAFQKPDIATIAMWMKRKSKRNAERRKCRVRADCRPPKTLTVAGNAELKAGDIASPVQMTSGKRRKITTRYAVL
jgi:hypothetical protein